MRIKYAILAGLILLLPMIGQQSCAREEVWEQELQYEARNRINELIRGLDTIPDQRAKYIKELVGMFNTKLRDLVSQQLKAGMALGNMQITLGIIEVYTAAGDTASIPVLANELLYSKSMAVRQSIILHLPLFCVQNRDVRAELQDIYESGERNVPPRLLDQMRKLPLNAKGEYDFSMDQDVRRPVEAAVAWQLQPVEAVIHFGLEKLNQDRAIEMLKHLVGVDLGTRRSSWVEFWRSRKRTYVSENSEEIERTQIAACNMLAAMGAECTPELESHCSWIMTTPFESVRLATLQMVWQIITLAVDRLPFFDARLKKKNGAGQSEELWVKRQIASAERLRKMVYMFSEKYSADKSIDIRLALMRCLGGAGQAAAVPHILKLMRADVQSHQMRLLAAESLGRCSGSEAVRVLSQMGAYRGIAVKRDLQIMEYQRVRAAFLALGEIVGTMKEGHLVCRDIPSSAQAAEFLIDSLQDSRRMVGAPPHENRAYQTVQYFARQALQQALGTGEKSFDPVVWGKLYKQLAASAQQIETDRKQESN